MNSKSLRFQLLVWYTTLVAIAFAAVSFFIYVAIHQFLLKTLRESVSKRARQIAHVASNASEPLSSTWLRGQIAALYAPETPESNGRFVRVATRGGKILFRSGTPADGSFDPTGIPFDVARKDGFRDHNAARANLLIRTIDVDSPNGAILVEVGAATTPVRDSLRQILLVLCVAGPCLIGIAAVGVYFLIGRALRPVLELAQSAEAITLQNVSEQLPVARSGDEIESLSLALNRMITRIHSAVETNRRFIADASHELRTPLAVLHAELETASSRNHISLDTREMLASHLEEVERPFKIVQGLFAMARFDCGDVQMDLVVFDLSQLAANTADQMCLLAEDKDIELSRTTPGPALVQGDRGRVKQVIVNLLDNAIKYTMPGGSVRIRTQVENGRAILEIRDTGIGISTRDRPLIFERFYRVDAARSREIGGAGLGLSIVKAICAVHSADVTVESAEGLGSRFLVSFPLAMPTEAARTD